MGFRPTLADGYLLAAVLVWSVSLLGERLSPLAPVTALIVLGCIAATQRART